MAGQYGMSFAAKLLEKGKYEEAIVEATRAIEREDDNPEHFVERATAAAFLERHAEAVSDLERALALDEEAGVLERDVVDDAYFSALLGAARALPVADGVARLDRYRQIFPSGRHLRDAADWQKRLRGELPSHFVKER
jgi:tetratricopeptide (TPR) repeat protein